jgi:hypothetical protein
MLCQKVKDEDLTIFIACRPHSLMSTHRERDTIVLKRRQNVGEMVT